MYILFRDERKSGRWFVIPEEHKEEFDKWYEMSYNHPLPVWAQEIEHPLKLKFYGYVYDK